MFWGLLWALCSFPLFFLSFHFFDQGAWYNSLFLAAVKIWCLYTGPHFSSSCPSDLFLTFFAQMAWSKKAQFSYNFLQKPYAPLLVPPSCFLPTGVEISTHQSAFWPSPGRCNLSVWNSRKCFGILFGLFFPFPCSPFLSLFWQQVFNL